VSAEVSETVYGITSAGGINFSDPLYSLNLPASINLGSQSQTILSYGNSQLQSWGLPGALSYGVDFTGDITAPVAGDYFFSLVASGSVVTLSGGLGVGQTLSSSSENDFTVHLNRGNNSFDLQYINQPGGKVSAAVTVAGFDPDVSNQAVPDSSEFTFLFPGALCLAHALRRRFAKV
jgi:hypothetical protein